MKLPFWADELATKVCLEYHIQKPEINWRRSRKKIREIITTSSGESIKAFRPKRLSSSGIAYTTENKITITAGSERRDQKLVLLHELAHMIAPKQEHHGEAFWKIAWALYRKYKVPINFAKSREYSYRKLARKVALQK